MVFDRVVERFIFQSNNQQLIVYLQAIRRARFLEDAVFLYISLLPAALLGMAVTALAPGPGIVVSITDSFTSFYAAITLVIWIPSVIWVVKYRKTEQEFLTCWQENPVLSMNDSRNSWYWNELVAYNREAKRRKTVLMTILSFPLLGFAFLVTLFILSLGLIPTCFMIHSWKGRGRMNGFLAGEFRTLPDPPIDLPH
ncbi:MAG: hypothetical protein ACFFD4_32515 [Candidatus Odinarchaeota archaeon]